MQKNIINNVNEAKGIADDVAKLAEMLCTEKDKINFTKINVYKPLKMFGCNFDKIYIKIL
jgi:hypothetical protein